MAEKTEKRLANVGDVVELVIGEEWRDNLSGISLYRGLYRLATQDELRRDRKVKDLGYVKDTNQRPTATLTEDMDLSRVEKALRLGILKKFDKNNPTIYSLKAEDKHMRVNDSEVDLGSRYSEDIDEMIVTALKLKIDKFQRKMKDIKSLTMLEKFYEAECEGRNPTAAPRKSYIDAIKTRMGDSDVGGVGKVTSKVSEIIKIE